MPSGTTSTKLRVLLRTRPPCFRTVWPHGRIRTDSWNQTERFLDGVALNETCPVHGGRSGPRQIDPAAPSYMQLVSDFLTTPLQRLPRASSHTFSEPRALRWSFAKDLPNQLAIVGGVHE